ncbi:hypothetical protein SAY86_017226 [Trapa natans]|uniref:Cell wall hydroxyproline-rich glycoprotein n=1 Tax=Trapa natans TaxID=22666 RepID=A0AAN7M166_TRANT|nr:hypothetical protein SAY86_017226 [Trapa natans]
MEKTCSLPCLLFLSHVILSYTVTLTAAGGGFGVGGSSGRGGSVLVGGGVNFPTAPPSFSNKLDLAYRALQAWKSSITEDPHGLLSSWVGPNVCSYKGIFCSSDQEDGTASPGSGRTFVAGIDLNRADIAGVLVKDLAALTDLALLHLNSNRFSGSIPGSFQALAALKELDLSNNLLSGAFPAVTLSMPSLVYLDIRFNDFSGPLPEELFETARLDAILLNNNRFQGDIPESLAGSQASVINLANNVLSGDIPASLGVMGSRVREILLLNNRLTGCIPEGLGLLSNVEVFDVSYNSLRGQLPDTISCLDQIQVLNLGHNRLSGILSDMVCTLKSLMNLTVAYNFFSGFSQDCEKLYDRNIGFDYSGNCIPDRQFQRPRPECSVGQGDGLSCLRAPAVKPLVCGAVNVLAGTVSGLASTSSHPPSPHP